MHLVAGTIDNISAFAVFLYNFTAFRYHLFILHIFIILVESKLVVVSEGIFKYLTHTCEYESTLTCIFIQQYFLVVNGPVFLKHLVIGNSF